jgi:uncharacterized protein
VTTAAPVSERERSTDVDALRGVALFGVFLANFYGFHLFLMATDTQLLALPSAAWDGVMTRLIRIFVVDKANTIFAFLFGVGFWLQMQRAEEKGADFTRLYLRRLTVLLLFGTAHLVLLWTWDILHLYALAGFALLVLRRASDRVLLIGGILLALFAREAVKAGLGVETEGAELFYSAEGVQLRQQLSAAGDYAGLLRQFTWGLWVDYLAGGVFLAWLLYALGRFMLGAWVARRGWLARPTQYLDGWKQARRIGLSYGLLLSVVAEWLHYYASTNRLGTWDGWKEVAEYLHLVATPLLSTGYVALIVLALQGRRGARLLAPFAAAGRMALTNYVAQSFVYALLLFGVWPGLALAGHIGTVATTVLVIGIYGLQLLFSTWWLRSFHYGPLEWCWRALTYGQRPPMRRQAALT